MAISYYTKEGLDKLKNELNQLKTKGRSNIAQQIAEARDKGDLSENAEYDAAKDAQGMLEMRIFKLEEKVMNARILDESKIDKSKIGMLATVKIKNKKNGKIFSYTLVPEEEADLKEKKISVKSPIAQGLINKTVGNITKVEVPAGKIEFEILSIDY